MVGRLRKLTVAAMLAAGACSVVFAQEPSPLPAKPSVAPPPPPNPPGNQPFRQKDQPGPNKQPPKRLDQFEEVRRFFDQLPPDQREKLRANFERWRNMPPEERDVLREREQVRREKMAREMDETLKKLGLNLDADHREVFALRYAQERRKIEEQLRKEMDAKRVPMLRDMMERLKTEFKNMSSAAASPSPTASPTMEERLRLRRAQELSPSPAASPSPKL